MHVWSCSPPGLPDSDQELAHLHVDILAAVYRVELAIGVAEQQASAQAKQTRLADGIKRREDQSNIFGVRTMKEKRLDDIKLEKAVTTPTNPPVSASILIYAVVCCAPSAWLQLWQCNIIEPLTLAP